MRLTSALAVVSTAAAIATLAAAVPPGQLRASQQPAPARGLTAVAGIRVGHHTLTERPTGCTVVLADGEGAVGGVSQRGAAPGTRETDLLNPLNAVERVNAIVLTGGSAYGLDAAQGVVRFLEEKKIGYPIAGTVVPIVPAAVLMDLGFGGSSGIRPTADCGYRAAMAASSGPVAEGNVGAGAGATVGKITGGRERAMKAGVGSASIALPGGLVVGAIAAVNAVGDVVDPATGAVVAGVRTADGKRLADARVLLRSPAAKGGSKPGENTTIAVVATNARLTKAEAGRVALMADDGLARAIYPAHTPADGDTVFALATGSWQGRSDVTTIGALAADALSAAIVRAAVQATSSGGLPAARDLGTVPQRFR
jgi:L-aminopeptidase/D-esterase-like protein